MSVLEKKHSISILIILYKEKSFEKGNVYQLELKKLLGHKSETIKNRLYDLRDAGLIKFEITSEFQHKEYIWVTPKGRRVAEKLVEIEEILRINPKLIL